MKTVLDGNAVFLQISLFFYLYCRHVCKAVALCEFSVRDQIVACFIVLGLYVVAKSRFCCCAVGQK